VDDLKSFFLLHWCFSSGITITALTHPSIHIRQSQVHPDKSPPEEYERCTQLMQEVNAAMQLLIKPEDEDDHFHFGGGGDDDDDDYYDDGQEDFEDFLDSVFFNLLFGRGRGGGGRGGFPGA
jgi:hypothetical protein